MKPTFFLKLQQTEQAVRQELELFFQKKVEVARRLHPLAVEQTTYLQEFMLRGGKFIRPFLTVCGYELAGGTANSALYQVAAAVEIYKNYVLNIDDMADRDILRHGGPTIEEIYRKQFAEQPPQTRDHYARSFSEVVGGVLETYATELLLSANIENAEQRSQALKELQIHLLQVTSIGWQIHFHQNLQSLAEADEQQFLLGLELVNSHYTFIGPLLVGSALAGNPTHDTTLREYGRCAGLAFQLQDDVLGLFGSPERTGKAVGNDVREGKKTILLQRAYALANTHDQQVLETACGNQDLSAKEVEQVQQIVRHTGALEYSQQLAHQYADQAVQSLDMLPASEQKTHLTELAYYIINRDK